LIKVINVITDTNIGGAGKILLSFLEKYDREKFDILVIIPTDSKLKEALEKIGVKYIEVEKIADNSGGKEAIGQLLDIFKNEQPQIVHTHASFGARRAAKKYNNCAIIYTRHSVFDQPKYKKCFPFKHISGAINNYYCDKVIAVSPAAKDNIAELGVNPQKIQVIFNGIEPQQKLDLQTRQQIRQKWGIEENDFVVSIIARLEEVKGHQYVLQAAQKLKNIDKNIKIIIAGTGSIEQKLRQDAVDLRLDNIIFTGFIKEIYEIENITDLQINCSYGTEATSLSLLEGMSLAIPAVVSDFGGNPFVIENGINGLVIKKKDSDALTEAILEFKNNKELYKRCSDGSLKVFNEKFTAESMKNQIQDVYTDILVQKGGKL
jgi:glycosyltransferase involved in cell wall biosynthesis